MDFSHLFWLLSAVGAGLFFCAGLSAGALRGGPTREPSEGFSKEAWAAREAALREAVARETAAAQTAARESQARQAAASDAALRLDECERLRSQLAACQATLKQAHTDDGDRGALVKRAEALEGECNRLRHEAKVATSEVVRLKAALSDPGRKLVRDSSAPAATAVERSTGPTSFQNILGRLSQTKGIRAAVLGDALGLPVASFGDQSESLAGFCGFISQAASKAKDFLQLGSIRRIVIEDERLATLTACSVPGTDIFLATLTSGPGPDFPRMVQVLNDVKSFMSQRSQA
ncbi:MAG TPA: roadblock/LC7 domain-containing protein [Polyangiaceae bacterium]|nr:roadblock/LC7 domain-containing protein [Polyangiaceae bacterium]